VVVGFTLWKASAAAWYALKAGPSSPSSASVPSGPRLMAASAAHAARTVRHNGNSGSVAPVAAVAQRGIDVVRLALAMIRVSQTVPGCGEAWWDVSASCRAALTSLAPVVMLWYNQNNPLSTRIGYTNMAKLKKALPKRRPGRPATGGRDPLTALRLPAKTTAAIDAWAKEAGTSRSGAIRQWIEAGLKRRPKV
jgi:hypothetical protein